MHEHRAFLQTARQAELPDPIAEVASKLAEDRRRRVGRKRLAALGIEAIDRLDQPEACDLHQVVELLGCASVAQGKRSRQRQKAPDQLLLQRGIAGLGVAAQELGLIRRLDLPVTPSRPAAIWPLAGVLGHAVGRRWRPGHGLIDCSHGVSSVSGRDETRK